MLTLAVILETILCAVAVGCMAWGCVYLMDADPTLHNGDTYFFRNGVRWTAIGGALAAVLMLVKAVTGS